MTSRQHFHDLAVTYGSSSSVSLTQHIQNVHAVVSTRYPTIDRIALAPYDHQAGALKTFISSNRDGMQLEHYEARLQDVPSLKYLAERRQIRVVDDIDATFSGATEHTLWLKSREYRSSLTIPIFQGHDLLGFLFFDSKLPSVFDTDSVRFLEAFSSLVTHQYLLQLRVFHGVEGVVQVARGLATIRDSETGQHLDRVAAYSQLMAQGLAKRLQLDDEFIAYVYMFAPLHDIGKVGIPDAILLKPGHLDMEERVEAERHVRIGESIVDQISKNLQMEESLSLRVLRNIVAAHHERGDGMGYPRKLKMQEIPLEARIVAVADVYDALLNRRPYKRPWSDADVEAELVSEVTKGRLDADCVNVLLQASEQRAAIHQKFVGQFSHMASH